MVDEIIQVIREISSRNDHDSELFLICPSSPYRKGQFEAVSCISSRPIKLCVTGRIRGRDHSATRDQSEETRRASKKGGGGGKKERKKSCQRKKRKEENVIVMISSDSATFLSHVFTHTHTTLHTQEERRRRNTDRRERERERKFVGWMESPACSVRSSISISIMKEAK